MKNDLYIMHYGVGHDKGGHSGRYPWGSGKNPYGGTKTINERDAKIFNKAYSSYFTKNSNLIAQSKEKKEFEYATSQLIKLYANENNLTSEDIIDILKNHSDARKDFVRVMMDDNTRIPSLNNKKVKDIVHSYRELFKKTNAGQIKILEDFLKKYDATTLYDMNKKYGKNSEEVARFIRNAYDKDRGALDKNSSYYSTDEKEWLEMFLARAFS